MKVKVKIEQEVEIAAVRMRLPVRYEEEDMPNDFPLRKGDIWEAEVEMDTGKIKDWPAGQTGCFSMKVCDGGTYTLLAPGGEKIAAIEQNCVPNGVIPGEYGDYVELEIDAAGIITNWPKQPDVSVFFDRE